MNNEQIQQDETSIRLNTLGCSMTVMRRNVKILHWNYHDRDFVSVHPWLDTVYDDLTECIDAVYEELRKGGFSIKATLTETVQNSKIAELPAGSVIYGNAETCGAVYVMLTAIRTQADDLATYADENHFWTVHELAVSILSKCNQINYFVKNSLTASVKPAVNSQAQEIEGVTPNNALEQFLVPKLLK